MTKSSPTAAAMSGVITPLRSLPHSGPQGIADADQGLRHVFVRDLVVACSIGVYDHEKDAPQRVRVNVDLGVRERDGGPLADSIEEVVCYEQIVNRVRSIVADGMLIWWRPWPSASPEFPCKTLGCGPRGCGWRSWMSSPRRPLLGSRLNACHRSNRRGP